ncbi:MAG: 1,2-phenylacetyl-CoA epoxidase subunit PaaC [Steroidobacteraceae bacterium]
MSASNATPGTTGAGTQSCVSAQPSVGTRASVSPQPQPATDARLRYLLRLGDTSLVLGQRLGEWIGHAPALEEDLGLANLALDLVGQARLLLSYAAEVEGKGRDEDALAFCRDAPQFMNFALAEQPNGDFAHTIVRQVLLDASQLEIYGGLASSTDTRLAAIAAKALQESRYHYRFSTGWLIRLGDGTEESHRRAQHALDALWRFTDELFAADALDEEMAAAGIAPRLAELQPRWSTHIDEVLCEATLQRPASAHYPWHGKRGVHTEHLGHMLSEMQHLQRVYPGAQW